MQEVGRGGPVNLELRRWGGAQEFKAILCYIVNSNPAWGNRQNAETKVEGSEGNKQTTTRSRRGKSGGWV